MTKNIKIKIKLKKIKTLRLKHEIELKRHNNMKTMKRKKSQTVVKNTEPKGNAKGFIEGGRKTSQVPTYDTSISHQYLTIFNCHPIRELSE